MSGTREFTAEQVAAVASADPRVRTLLQALELRDMLLPAQPLALLMAALGDDADRAMREFAVMDLGDWAAVKAIQARVFTYQFAFATYEAVMARGNQAQESIRDEDPQAPDA